MKEHLNNLFKSRFAKDQLIQDMNWNPEVYDAVAELSLQDKRPQSWRASFVLEHCTKKKDDRILPYVDQILKFLPNKEDGHQRCLLRILVKSELNDEQESKLFNLCISLWESINKIPSVRIVALQFLLQTARKYPELLNELEFLFENRYADSLSLGIRGSFKRLKQEFQKLSNLKRKKEGN